jgi:hypothetical protein
MFVSCDSVLVYSTCTERVDPLVQDHPMLMVLHDLDVVLVHEEKSLTVGETRG